MSYHTKMERLACHEAGHAVVGWYYRHVLMAMELDINPARPRGLTLVGPMLANIGGVFCPHEVEQEIDISMAGKAAEMHIFGETDGKDLSEEDYQNALYLAKVRANLLQDRAAHDEAAAFPERVKLPGDKAQADRLFEKYGANVRELVARPHFEHCIRSLAGALLAHTFIQGSAAQLAIKRAWDRSEGDRAEAAIKAKSAPGWGEWRKVHCRLGQEDMARVYQEAQAIRESQQL